VLCPTSFVSARLILSCGPCSAVIAENDEAGVYNPGGVGGFFFFFYVSLAKRLLRLRLLSVIGPRVRGAGLGWTWY
jgi:hypothetical protein